MVLLTRVLCFSSPFSILTFSTEVEIKKSFIEGWEQSGQKNETVLRTIFLELSSPVGRKENDTW